MDEAKSLSNRPARDIAGTVSGDDTLQVRVPVGMLKRVIALLTAVVIALGVFREVFVWLVGTETILQDLRPFALDAELNLGAWYSSSLMLLSALLLFAIGCARLRDRHRIYWFVLALLFVGLSADETISGHETLILPLKNALNTSGLLHFAWVIPGALFVVTVGILFVPFLLALPRRTAFGFAAAGGVYVLGALGMEFVSGYVVSTVGWDSLSYIAAAVVEESLEMIGLTLFLYVLIGYMSMSASRNRN